MKNDISDLPAPLQIYVRDVQSSVAQLARSAMCRGRQDRKVMEDLDAQIAADGSKTADRITELLNANNTLVETYRKWRRWALAFATEIRLFEWDRAADKVREFDKARAVDRDLFSGMENLAEAFDHRRPSWRQPVTLEECPVGLFECQGELCVKTEYRVSNEDRRCTAYIVASGEFFCGPPGSSKQNDVMVVPVGLPAFWAQAQKGGGTGFRPTHRHKKRGSTYEVLYEAGYQESQPGEQSDLVDDTLMIVYRGEDGQVWVRTADGFHDGRFERV
jgi:hypothetical protein